MSEKEINEPQQPTNTFEDPNVYMIQIHE